MSLFPNVEQKLYSLGDHQKKIGMRFLTTFLDAWTGGAVSQAMKDDMGISDAIEKGYIEMGQLEGLKSALMKDLNRIQSEIDQLKDPSEAMENEILPALNNMGFSVDTDLKRNLYQKMNVRDAEIKKAHEDYVDKRNKLTQEAANKSEAINEAEKKSASLQRELDLQSARNPATEWATKNGL